MEMIWHEQKQRDVPALFDLVKSSAIQQRLRECGVSQWASLFFAVNGDSDVKQRAGLDPVRDFMMQFGREPAVEHRIIVKRAFGALQGGSAPNTASPPFLPNVEVAAATTAPSTSPKIDKVISFAPLSWATARQVIEC